MAVPAGRNNYAIYISGKNDMIHTKKKFCSSECLFRIKPKSMAKMANLKNYDQYKLRITILH